MPHFAPAHWQDLGTGSGWIAMSGKAEFSQDFAAVLAEVKALNAPERNGTGQWFVAEWEPSAHEWFGITPVEGLDRCECGAKYWDGLYCHSCAAPFKGAEAFTSVTPR